MNSILRKEDVKVVRINERARTKYQRIHINDLYYGNYQRILQTPWVDKLAKNFDEGLLGVLIVSHRDGKYYVIDGQHRLEASKRIGIDELVCQVHIGLSYEEEAKLFSRYNKERKVLTPSDVFNSDLEAGDEAALEILNTAQKYGFNIHMRGGGRNAREDKIVAVAMLRNIHKKDGNLVLDRVFKLIRNTWDGHKVALQRNVLGGMAVFVRLYGDDFTDEDFADKLRKVHPDIILRDGRVDADYTQNSKLTIPYAKAIWRLYNKGLRSNKLEDRFVGNYR